MQPKQDTSLTILDPMLLHKRLAKSCLQYIAWSIQTIELSCLRASYRRSRIHTLISMMPIADRCVRPHARCQKYNLYFFSSLLEARLFCSTNPRNLSLASGV